MNLYFIRHGHPDYEKDALTGLGRQQAELLASRVRLFDLHEIHHSPMGRACETAGFVNRPYDLPLVEQRWLRELEWGDRSGDAYATASPWTILDEMLASDRAYPAGDSWKADPRLARDRLVADVENRCLEFDRFLAEYGCRRAGQLYCVERSSSRNLAFVCHGGLSCALASHLLNIPFWQFIAHFPMDVTAVTKISLSGDEGAHIGAKAEYVNSCAHLGRE